MFDIAIVGCGPVGATLGNLLGRAGHRIAVVEAKRAIYDKPRAIILDHEALRIFQHCGLLDEVLAHTAIHPGTDYLGAEDQVIKRFNPLPAPFPLGLPPTVSFVQPEIDAILRHGLERFQGIETFIPYRLSGLNEKESHVELHLDDEEGGAVRTIEARYVIGAEGANSVVRRSFGLPLEDLAFDEWWMVVDVRLLRDVALPKVMVQYCRPSRPATFVIGPGALRRWEIKLLPGETPDDFAEEHQILAHLAPFVARDAIEIWRAAVYRFNAGVAQRWRSARCFLAGDSAHQMPPFLGQGLCCGLRDAGNLAWKLDMVLAGKAGAGLLDTYETERKPHIRDLVVTAKEFGLIIGELDPVRARVRDEALRAELLAGRAEQIRQKFIPNITAGLIDQTTVVSRRVSGTLFVQPKVRVGGKGLERLLDDVTDHGFQIVSQEPGVEARVAGKTRAARQSLGGSFVTVLPSRTSPPPDGPDAGLVATSDLLGDWLRDNGSTYAVVRPDRIVYGAAATISELDAVVSRLVAAVA